MINLQANAILSESCEGAAEAATEIARDIVEALISAALTLPTERFHNLRIFVLPDGPLMGPMEIGQVAAANAIAPR
jgi:hypothetical protein